MASMPWYILIGLLVTSARIRGDAEATTDISDAGDVWRSDRSVYVQICCYFSWCGNWADPGLPATTRYLGQKRQYGDEFILYTAGVTILVAALTMAFYGGDVW